VRLPQSRSQQAQVLGLLSLCSKCSCVLAVLFVVPELLFISGTCENRPCGASLRITVHY
jgi:hypothetical protein